MELPTKLTFKNICDDVAKQLTSKTVALLLGGESSERQGSLDDSKEIRVVLSKYVKELVLISTDDVPKMIDDLKKVDLAYVCLYGGYGEDGRIQGLLDILGKPYQGSHTLTSSIGMNKYIFNKLLASWDFPVPQSQRVSEWVQKPSTSLKNVSNFVVKPVDEGDSYGIQFYDQEQKIKDWINSSSSKSLDNWVVEEFIEGQPGTMSLIGYKGTIFAGRPLVLTLPKGENIYSNELKHVGSHRVEYSFLEGTEADGIVDQAQKLYRLLDCKGAVRFDFIHGSETKYIEMNTLPGLYSGSNLSVAFKHLMDFDQLVLMCISSAVYFNHRGNSENERIKENEKT